MSGVFDDNRSLPLPPLMERLLSAEFARLLHAHFTALAQPTIDAMVKDVLAGLQTSVMREFEAREGREYIKFVVSDKREAAK
jgi:membrane glycosyltransferase